MTNEMNLVLTEKFDTTSCEFYKNEQDEIWLTREQVGRALGYANPVKAIQKIHLDHKDRMDLFSIQIKEPTTNTLNMRNSKSSESGVVVGMAQPSRSQNSKLQTTVTYYSQRGIMEICRWSEMPRANDFMDWVYDVIEAYRRNEIVASKKAILAFEEKINEMQNTLLQVQESQKTIETTASTALAGVNALNSGMLSAQGREIEWINEVSPEIEKLAKHWGRHDPQICVMWLIDELDGKDSGYQIAPYKFIDYKRKYISDNPGTKPTRLTVVASDSQYRALFTEVLHRKLQEYDEEFNEQSSLFSRMIVELGDPIEGGNREKEPDWNDPAFLAMCDEFDAYRKRNEEMEAAQREAMTKMKSEDFGDFDDIID